MSVMKKISAINELKNMVNKYPEYTLGEILFTVCREATFKNGTGKLSDLLNIEDKDIYTAVDNSLQREQPETETFN